MILPSLELLALIILMIDVDIVKKNAFTINPKDLSRFFEPFLGIVVESEKGELLSDILQNTFNIFNEKTHNTKKLQLSFFLHKTKMPLLYKNRG